MNKIFLCFLVPLLFFVSCTESYDLKSFEAMNTFMTVKSYGKNLSLSEDTFFLLQYGLSFYEKSSDFDFIFISTDNELYYSSGLENKISVIGEFKRIQVLR